MAFSTRAARPVDIDAVLLLLPRLADYELPHRRTSEMFWADDAELVRRWASGEAPDTIVRVGVDRTDTPVAVGVVTMGHDRFSGERCAHLEVVVVAPEADGSSLGRRLIAELEIEATEQGAVIMSLHVMGNNVRARHVYAGLGFHEEMIRAVKFLDPGEP